MDEDDDAAKRCFWWRIREDIKEEMGEQEEKHVERNGIGERCMDAAIGVGHAGEWRKLRRQQ